MTSRIRRPWMSLADRRAWRAAETLADLGELMAQWLEGTIASWPGYAPGYGPDSETEDLIPVLAAANRAGYLTISSQPGTDVECGRDGRLWEQRAAVQGFLGDQQLLLRLRALAEREHLKVIAHARQAWPSRLRSGLVVTRAGEDHDSLEDYTLFGDLLSERDLRAIWPVISPRAFAAVTAAWQVTLVDPVWGGSDRLWRLLAAVVADEETCVRCGCTERRGCPGACWWVEPYLCAACA